MAIPMYDDWADGELDTDFMPFLCGLVAALAGKPCLAEEWGGCTNPDGDESTIWEWTSYGGIRRTQFMAGESALADHVEAVLPKLVEVGATGAMLWCFADYAESLWDRPPCDPHGAKHERHFGLVRPDGTVKPHAEAIRRFAATNPVVQACRSGRRTRRHHRTSTTPTRLPMPAGSTPNTGTVTGEPTSSAAFLFVPSAEAGGKVPLAAG